MSCEHYDDPVAAYDRLATSYATHSKRRQRYLHSVEREVAARAQGAGSLLDLGAGDGSRAARIAASAGIGKVVLLEPSAAMAIPSARSAELWQIRAEDLRPDRIAQPFDVITCLWNVLGHISPGNRERVLRMSAELLSPSGKIFLDVNHRYNARSYGWVVTWARWLRDAVTQDAHPGDVTAVWDLDEGRRVSTYGHVFTHREIKALTEAAGLEIEERIIVDYDDGALRDLPWLGNLLYIFRRTSRIDSSRAPATS